MCLDRWSTIGTAFPQWKGSGPDRHPRPPDDMAVGTVLSPSPHDETHIAQKAFSSRNLGEHQKCEERFRFQWRVLLFRNQIECHLSYYATSLRLAIGVAIMILPDNLPILCCPSCGGIMKQVRNIPRPGSPNLQVVACLCCNEVEVLEEMRAAQSFGGMGEIRPAGN